MRTAHVAPQAQTVSHRVSGERRFCHGKGDCMVGEINKSERTGISKVEIRRRQD